MTKTAVVRMTSENEIVEVLIGGVACENWEVEYVSKEEEKKFLEKEYGEDEDWNDDFSFLDEDLEEEVYWNSDNDQEE